MWQDERHRAAKLHVAFAALRQVPGGVTLTAGSGSERAEVRRLVQPGGFYVFDRGYVAYGLFEELHPLPCSFVARVQERAAYEVAQAQPRSDPARAAGVQADALRRRVGTEHHRPWLSYPLCLVVVTTAARHPDGPPVVLLLVTNRLDLDAELIALAYR